MKNRVNVQSMLVVLAMIIVVAILFAVPLAPTQADAPWRPTLTPAPTPTVMVPWSHKAIDEHGAYIRLRAEFPSAWPWDAVHWQEPCTLVQWQGYEGEWHNVERWRGALDTIAIVDKQPLRVIGEKVWWVAEDDLGTGLFRWLVYRSDQEVHLLVTSEVFTLPHETGEFVTVNVMLSMLYDGP